MTSALTAIDDDCTPVFVRLNRAMGFRQLLLTYFQGWKGEKGTGGRYSWKQSGQGSEEGVDLPPAAGALDHSRSTDLYLWDALGPQIKTECALFP